MNAQEIGAVIGVLLVVGIGFTSLMFIGGQFDIIDEQTDTNYNHWTVTHIITTPTGSENISLPQAESIVSVSENFSDGGTHIIDSGNYTLSNGNLQTNVSFWTDRYNIGYSIGTTTGNSNIDDAFKATKGNATISGYVINITTKLQDWVAGEYVKCALYYENNLSLYKQTPELTTGAADGVWFVFPFSTYPNITAGTLWFIGSTSNCSVKQYVRTGGSVLSDNGGRYDDDNSVYNPLTSPVSWDSSSTANSFNIYATVMPLNATALTITYERDIGNVKESTHITFTFLFFLVILAALLLIVGVLMRYR